MTEQATHPVKSGVSKTDQAVERINSNCFRFGMLGFIAFLEYLSFVFAPLEVAQIFYLFFLLFLVLPVLGFVRYLINYFRTGNSETSSNPVSWVESGYEPSPLKSLMHLLMMVHPMIIIQGTLQILGNAVILLRYRTNPPEPDGYESDVDYRLPFNGEWTVVNGSPDRWYSHSWFPSQQRYAYDFVITDDEGRTHEDKRDLDSFYCFDEPILAPAEGTVVAAKDGHRDYHRTTGWFDPLQYRIFGNYVVIKHDEGEYSVSAHLKKGSVCVSEGDRVERGEEIGRCGHSGNSTEPHLHFHLQDHPNLYLGMGIPVEFSSTTTDHPETESTHSERTYIHCGQTVSYNQGGNTDGFKQKERSARTFYRS